MSKQIHIEYEEKGATVRVFDTETFDSVAFSEDEAVRLLQTHAGLLAACKLALEPESYQGDGRPWPHLLMELRKAVAKAEGN